MKTPFTLCLTCAALFAYLFSGWSQSPWIVGMDQGFFRFFGSITQKSWALDILVVQMLGTDTAKILPLLTCVVWLLFQRRQLGKNNNFVGQMLLGSVIAMIASRLMQNLSAYRPRPLHNMDLGYQLPYGVDTATLEGWSSFPSDTSSLAFAVAAGIFVGSKRLGTAAFVWAAVVVAFPRAYAGFHYPSDLIGGALIGIVATFGIAPLLLRGAALRSEFSLNEKWVPFLWALAFMFMFQMGTLFDDVRAYGSYTAEVLGL